MIKRFNTFIRAALLMLTLPLAFSVIAQDQFWVNGIHYEVDYDNFDYFSNANMVYLKVIGTNGSSTYSGDITIPETVTVRVSRYNGSHYGGNYDAVCHVRSIGNAAFRDCTGLTGITLPKSLKSIGENAFYGCSGLTRVTMASGVSTISESAFAYCTSLTAIELPNSVTSIGWNAFYNCTALSNVTLSKSLTTLNGTFHGCKALTTMTIPGGVTALNGTFNGCTSLTSVTLPRSLRQVGESTFAGCSALASIHLPDGLMTIGNQAFSNTGLTTLEFPGSVSRLGENAFDGSTQLTAVTCRNLTPPYMANSEVFTQDTYGTAALYVPEVSVSRYSSADWWNLFDGIEGKVALNNHYDFEVNGIYYLITGPNSVEVTYDRAGIVTYSGNVVVPSTVSHNGVTYNVTGIGTKAFKGSYQLNSVTMPQSITYISNCAFAHCGALSTVNIPESVTTIGDSAFFSLPITELTIPASVTSIGLNAFMSCENITSLTWNARECWTNGDMPTPGITQLTIGNEVKVIPSHLAYNSVITSLAIPSSVTIIDREAFYGCANLTSLTVPENVASIGDKAFYGLSQLTSLSWNASECWTNGNMPTTGITQLAIGDGVKVLPYQLAAESQITSVNIPSSVIHIAPGAFYNCDELASVVIPDNVVTIGGYAFYWCHDLKEVTIGKNVSAMDMFAFGYTPIETLHWNARHVTSPMQFETNDYYEDNSYVIDYYYVTSLTIGDEVEVLPDYFAKHSQITSVDIPASVTSIGVQAFNCCSRLANVTLTGNLRTVGDAAFADCNSLNDVTLPEGLTSVGESAFSSCSQFRNLSIPASLISLGKWSFNYCNGLESIVVAAANPVYDSRDNCNAIFKTANDSIVLMCKNTTFPSSMTAIPDSMFYNHTEIKSFVIPPTVTHIGKDAFNGTGLTSITIPASVTSIGTRAFSRCQNLNTIQVEEGNPVYDSRDNCNAIVETASNTLIEGSKSTVIPGTVTAIGNAAFYMKSPSTVNIPESVKTIGDSAFYYCSNLSSLNLGGGVETIGNYAFGNCFHLSDLAFGDAVKTIGDYTFSVCPSLSSLTMGNSVETIGNGAFKSCSKLRNIVLNNSLKHIGNSAFAGTMCQESTSDNIHLEGPGEDGIGYYIIDAQLDDYYSWAHIYYYDDEHGHYYEDEFYGDFTSVYYYDYLGEIHYVELTVEQITCSLVVPNSVTTIGSSAFSGCDALNSILLPNSLTAIEASTFYQCSLLKGINIPESVKSIGNYAFYACNALDSVGIASLPAWCDIDFSNNYSTPFCYADRMYLNGNEVTELVIPDGVPAIKRYAFLGCKELTSVTIPNTVTDIGNYAFSNCAALMGVTLPESVASIGQYAFSNCKAMTSADVPNSVTSIGNYAFYNCSGLTSVSLGCSLQSVGTYAFYNGNAITDVTSFATTPPTAGTKAFSCYNKATLHVPAASLDAYSTANEWKRFTTIETFADAAPGDLNGDGQLSVSDITMLINAIINADENGVNNPVADLNGDGIVNISDIVMLIDMVMRAR